MPLRTLQISTLEKNGTERLQEVEPKLDASVYGSHINNLIRSMAYAIYPVTFLAEDILKDAFPQFAEGDALDQNFGVMESLERKSASKSTGNICIYGDVGVTVPFQTLFTVGDVNILTNFEATIGSWSVVVVSASSSGGVATVTTQTQHLLPVGGDVLVSIGSIDFDGTYEIIGSTEFSFSYKITNQNSIVGASGVASANVAHVLASSEGFGLSQNVLGSVELDGDFDAFTLSEGMTGGAQAELDSDYSARLIKKRSLIEGVFTKEQVEESALRVAGNTRAWCVTPQDGVFGGTPAIAGYKPQPGETCVYIVRDGDNGAPASNVILELTQQSIIDFGQMPCHTIADDIHVYSPLSIGCTFQIDNLVPDNAAMRAAVEESLRSYMQDVLDFEDDFTDKQQIATISNASTSVGKVVDFDLINGDFVAGSGGLLQYLGVIWSS